MAQIKPEVQISLLLSEREFRLVCHCLTGSEKLRADDRKAALELGLTLMKQRSSHWREKLDASNHALACCEEAQNKEVVDGNRME